MAEDVTLKQISEQLTDMTSLLNMLVTKVDALETKVDSIAEWQETHDERFSHLMAHLVKEGIYASQ